MYMHRAMAALLKLPARGRIQGVKSRAISGHQTATRGADDEMTCIAALETLSLTTVVMLMLITATTDAACNRSSCTVA